MLYYLRHAFCYCKVVGCILQWVFILSSVFPCIWAQNKDVILQVQQTLHCLHVNTFVLDSSGYFVTSQHFQLKHNYRVLVYVQVYSEASELQSWSELLVNMIKEGCENVSALFIPPLPSPPDVIVHREVLLPEPYHPAAQDWLRTEAKQGWDWLVPGLETSWEN